MTYKILYNQHNCSSSQNGQDYEDHHLDCSIKLGEPEEGVTVFYTGLLSTGTVAMVLDQRALKNYLTYTFTHNVFSLFHFRPNIDFLGKCPMAIIKYMNNSRNRSRPHQ